jgi:hypothetical protein
MQSNANYIASAAINQYDLITIDSSSTTDLTLFAKPASEGDVIMGRANSKAGVGDLVNFTELTVGTTITCIAGGSISAGDHLAADSGKVVKGTASLIACESASEGDKIRVVMVAELNDQPANIELDSDGVIEWGDEELTAPSMSGEIGLNPGGVHLEVIDGGNKAVFPVGSVTFLAIKVKTTLYAGSTISAANLSSYKPVNFTVAPETGAITMSQINAGFVLTGIWKILVGGTNADDNGIILILAQRIE